MVSILNYDASADIKEFELNKNLTRVKQFTTPALSDWVRENIHTFTAIHVGITSITWAQLTVRRNQQTLLSDWSFHEISDKKLHLNELVDRVLTITKDIPESNIYIFETPRIAQQGPQGTPAQININIQLSQTIAMVALAMQMRCQATAEFDAMAKEQAKKSSVDESGINDDTISKQVLFLRQYLFSR